MNSEEEKLIVMEMMDKYGSSFVKGLAQALSCADPINTLKIIKTWPDLWKEYLNLYSLKNKKKTSLDELKQQWIEAIKRKGLFPVRKCSICGSYIGYLYVNDQLCFNRGCHCSGRSNYRPREEKELDFYLEDYFYIEKIKEFIRGE